MELLEKKLSLMKEINKLTENLQSILSNEKYEELNDVLEKRLSLMNQIDDIDTRIERKNFNTNENTADIQKQIKVQLQKIIDIDNKAKQILIKKDKEYQFKLSEIDTKLKTGNYDIAETEKKPKGYFLNRKS